MLFGGRPAPECPPLFCGTFNVGPNIIKYEHKPLRARVSLRPAEARATINLVWFLHRISWSEDLEKDLFGGARHSTFYKCNPTCHRLQVLIPTQFHPKGAKCPLVVAWNKSQAEIRNQRIIVTSRFTASALHSQMIKIIGKSSYHKQILCTHHSNIEF